MLPKGVDIGLPDLWSLAKPKKKALSHRDSRVTILSTGWGPNSLLLCLCYPSGGHALRYSMLPLATL